MFHGVNKRNNVMKLKDQLFTMVVLHYLVLYTLVIVVDYYRTLVVTEYIDLASVSIKFKLFIKMKIFYIFIVKFFMVANLTKKRLFLTCHNTRTKLIFGLYISRVDWIKLNLICKQAMKRIITRRALQ